MTVTTYTINEGTNSQFYVLVDARENQVLYGAPNNWRTERGAKKWAEKHGFTVQERD